MNSTFDPICISPFGKRKRLRRWVSTVEHQNQKRSNKGEKPHIKIHKNKYIKVVITEKSSKRACSWGRCSKNQHPHCKNKWKNGIETHQNQLRMWQKGVTVEAWSHKISSLSSASSSSTSSGSLSLSLCGCVLVLFYFIGCCCSVCVLWSAKYKQSLKIYVSILFFCFMKNQFFFFFSLFLSLYHVRVPRLV